MMNFIKNVIIVIVMMCIASLLGWRLRLGGYMNKYVMCFLFMIMLLGSPSVNTEDIKMYDNYGRYTGVMEETSSGYKMYDSSGRYTGEMKSTSNGYKTYDSSSRYTGNLKKTNNGYNSYNSSGRYTGSYRK